MQAPTRGLRVSCHVAARINAVHTTAACHDHAVLSASASLLELACKKVMVWIHAASLCCVMTVHLQPHNQIQKPECEDSRSVLIQLPGLPIYFE